MSNVAGFSTASSTPTKEEVNAFARVCLSVCLSVSKITQKRVHGFGWNVACRQMSGHGRTESNWLTFDPDPDYSPDARTGLFSPISYALQRGILLRPENPTYRNWAPVAAERRGIKMVLFTAIRGVVYPELKWYHFPRIRPLRPSLAYQAPQKLGIVIFRPLLHHSWIFPGDWYRQKKRAAGTANHPRRPRLSF